ncbi:hypothetical protein [Rhodococcus globerulus]|uniref:Uncharacterized protein n=1 Tax=Rhodococcus globerulus TaxID=33008 RepID=A0ABU4C5V2_RHOGO|nr:hypothetical protein [Rhodococcus globerulus]MDV6271743.1 hypothetical protein [Rhodococcus globerulus]
MNPPDSPNYAQARVLLVALYSEIDGVLSEADAVNDAAAAAWRAGHHLTYRERVTHRETLREKLYELHRMVDNINARFPGIDPSERVPRE